MVICDGLQGSFAAQAKFDTFWIKVPQRTFVQDPEAVLHMLRTISVADIRHRQQMMATHAADVLYTSPKTRLGWNFLKEASSSRCGLNQRASCRAH